MRGFEAESMRTHDHGKCGKQRHKNILVVGIENEIKRCHRQNLNILTHFVDPRLQNIYDGYQMPVILMNGNGKVVVRKNTMYTMYRSSGKNNKGQLNFNTT
ncbi:hypothetical protein T4D_5828 [Trichinella pseudospiralis]|uniref:Uncharacterized protein n=1 Tax=Trichinella pseudospiralis TaxID=6337 RepID=A0A0V1FTL0_TRIPS|nr:hypothetical protein T4D_5828 [Trichinella pseudospiralis]